MNGADLTVPWCFLGGEQSGCRVGFWGRRRRVGVGVVIKQEDKEAQCLFR